MTSVCMRFCAFVMSAPMPEVALICSAATRTIQAIPSEKRRPTSQEASAPGSTTWRMRPQRPEAEDAPRLDELPVDAADAPVEVDVDRERDGEGDEQHLRALVDAEPEDEERHERQRGHRAEHLDERVDEPLADGEEAGDDREGGPDRDAEQQAERDAPEGDEERVGQVAAAGEVPGRRGDRAGRGEGLRLDAAGGGGELPHAQEHERPHDDEPARARDVPERRGRAGPRVGGAGADDDLPRPDRCRCHCSSLR